MAKQADTFNLDQSGILARCKIEYLDIDQIRANDYNPNRQGTHDFELLCKSIAADGFTQPVVITADGTIVDGEHRWRACKALGYTRIAVVRTKMSPEQARISTLRHNRARGSENAELAADVLRELAEMGAIEYAQDELSLDDLEVKRLLEDIAAEDVNALDIQVTPEELGAAGGGLTSGDIAAGVDTTADERRARERKLLDMKEKEEAVSYAKDTGMYRLLVVLTGEQAEVVKAVIGANRADAILALCREEAARRAS